MTTKTKEPMTPRRRRTRLTQARPHTVVQTYAVDDFGELAARKRAAEATARQLGHDLLPWHPRQDPAGRWNSYCATCNQAVVVATEVPDGFADFTYGRAVTQVCGVHYGQEHHARVPVLPVPVPVATPVAAPVAPVRTRSTRPTQAHARARVTRRRTVLA